MSQFDGIPDQNNKIGKLDSSELLEFGTDNYSIIDDTQESRKGSAEEASAKLKIDQAARRNYLINNLNPSMDEKELSELRKLMHKAKNELPDTEKKDAWDKIQRVEEEKRNARK